MIQVAAFSVGIHLELWFSKLRKPFRSPGGKNQLLSVGELLRMQRFTEKARNVG